jgi:large subunit ribosomal protein L29
MKREDIKELSNDELRLRLEEEKALYVKMKMNHAISPIENPMKIRVTRRGIAMLHTELTKRMKDAAAKQQ